MSKMFCPNCSCRVDYEDYCGNCGVNLVYVNDVAILKSQYDEVENFHSNYDKFIVTAENNLENFSDTVYTDEFFFGLCCDEVEKNNFLKTLNETETSLISFRNDVNMTLNDEVKMDYLRSLNFVFGDVDFKIKKIFNLIEEILQYIQKVRNKIKYYEETHPFNNNTVEDVEIFSSYIDDMLEDIQSAKKDLSNGLKNHEIQEELRNNPQIRQEIKNSINISTESINRFKTRLNQKKEEIEKISKTNKKYSDLKDKSEHCKKEIDEYITISKKYLQIIREMEQPQKENRKNLNNNRILDL